MLHLRDDLRARPAVDKRDVSQPGEGALVLGVEDLELFEDVGRRGFCGLLRLAQSGEIPDLPYTRMPRDEERAFAKRPSVELP